MADPITVALISAAGALGSSAIQAGAQKRAVKDLEAMAPPTLSYDEARAQAGDVLNPIYNKQLEDTLAQVDRANIARGFYGQLPGDVLKRSTAGEIETSRAGQIGSLAQQMYGQSQQQALQQQQLAAQYALAQGANKGNIFNQMLNTGLGLYDANRDFKLKEIRNWWEMTGHVPEGYDLGGINPLATPNQQPTTNQFLAMAKAIDWAKPATFPQAGQSKKSFTNPF